MTCTAGLRTLGTRRQVGPSLPIEKEMIASKVRVQAHKIPWVTGLQRLRFMICRRLSIRNDPERSLGARPLTA